MLRLGFGAVVDDDDAAAAAVAENGSAPLVVDDGRDRIRLDGVFLRAAVPFDVDVVEEQR